MPAATPTPEGLPASPSAVRVHGRDAAYLERRPADPCASPLLLVHGFTGSKEDFAEQLQGLAKHRRVIAVDLPGHGGTPGPRDPAAYGLAALADWVVAFADAAGMGEFHLLGHSFGGLVAQRVAFAHSHRLTSLVLMDTGMGAPREEACDIAVDVAVAVRDDGLEAGWKVSQDAAARNRAHLEVDDVREEFARQRFLRLEPDAVVGEVRSIIAAAPLGAFLRGIDVPVLVIHGEDDDVWLPSEQARLARVTNAARLAVVPDSRHSPQIENPDAWLGAVRAFLAEADGAHGG